jgi:type IV secretory pathway VirD2 relaxase
VGGDQYFVVVIERRTAAKDYLKIRPEDISRYFGKGLEFVVKSNRRPTREEEKELFAAGRESLAETVRVANRLMTPEAVNSRCRSFSMIQTTAYLWNDPCLGTLVAQASEATAIEPRALTSTTLGALR